MTRRLLVPALIAVFAIACDDAATNPDALPEAATEAQFKKTRVMTEMDQSPIYQDFSAWNARLREEGLDLELVKYEFLTVGATGKAGRTVLASDRDKNIGFDWAPGDPRREGRANLTWAIDGTQGATTSGITQGETDQATMDAMQTWQDVRCSNIPLDFQGVLPFDVGVVQALLGMGGSFFIYADYQHTGFLAPDFFEAVQTGGGAGILGVTFTFACWNNFGGPVDLDGNGLVDTCYSETYYNDGFFWAIDAPADPFGPIDVETVIVHEAGHGLSQGHFGDIFFDASGWSDLGGKFYFQHLHFAPYAVMNAAIWKTQQDLTGTDRAGHCTIWGAWPNN
jgi:hypothetical protein